MDVETYSTSDGPGTPIETPTVGGLSPNTAYRLYCATNDIPKVLSNEMLFVTSVKAPAVEPSGASGGAGKSGASGGAGKSGASGAGESGAPDALLTALMESAKNSTCVYYSGWTGEGAMQKMKDVATQYEQHQHRHLLQHQLQDLAVHHQVLVVLVVQESGASGAG